MPDSADFARAEKMMAGGQGLTLVYFSAQRLRGRSPCTLRNWKVQWCVPVCRELTTDTRPTSLELSNHKTVNQCDLPLSFLV